jgi:hypothetical protein
MGHDKEINKVEKQIKTLEKEKKEIQDKCLHKETKVNFEEGKNTMRLFCVNCNVMLGFPSQEEINKFLNNNKDEL